MADIYNNSVAQGPSLPEANRSATMKIYNSDLPLLRSRLLGALSTVRSHVSIMLAGLWRLCRAAVLQNALRSADARRCADFCS